jgi:hypothetical protein
MSRTKVETAPADLQLICASAAAKNSGVDSSKVLPVGSSRVDSKTFQVDLDMSGKKSRCLVDDQGTCNPSSRPDADFQPTRWAMRPACLRFRRQGLSQLAEESDTSIRLSIASSEAIPARGATSAVYHAKYRCRLSSAPRARK